ncbi:hypothetical protein ACOCJ7_15060 [Knoellia sp. CPCC 206453]|uniref:hypothetical protein n=1 Tax=Knoellia pratensis TaxID=3404796 RepID=UPI003607FD04
MGIIDSISRALGGLGSLSAGELEDQREALRLRYVSSGDVGEASKLYNDLHRYDAEMTRRANEAYARENPNPPEPRHREHGWYLENDD